MQALQSRIILAPISEIARARYGNSEKELRGSRPQLDREPGRLSRRRKLSQEEPGDNLDHGGGDGRGSSWSPIQNGGGGGSPNSLPAQKFFETGPRPRKGV